MKKIYINFTSSVSRQERDACIHYSLTSLHFSLYLSKTGWTFQLSNAPYGSHNLDSLEPTENRRILIRMFMESVFILCYAATAKTSKQVWIKIGHYNSSVLDISSLIVLVLNLKMKNTVFCIWIIRRFRKKRIVSTKSVTTVKGYRDGFLIFILHLFQSLFYICAHLS